MVRYQIFFKKNFIEVSFGVSAATPGYFTSTFVNNIKIEATSTRRAGLIRFTYPSISVNNSVVVDLTHDLQRSFQGGTLSITPTGRVQLEGTFFQVGATSIPKECIEIN